MTDPQLTAVVTPPSTTSASTALGGEKHTAPVGKRFWNFFLDSIFCYIFSFIVGIGYAIVIISIGSTTTTLKNFMVTVFAYIAYFVFFESIWQRTPAKWITKTKLVKLDGTKPELWRVFVRSLARDIPFDALSFFFGKYSFGWHDRISKTMVVPAAYTVEEAASVNPRDKGKSTIALVFFFIVIISIPLIGILSSIILVALGDARNKVHNAEARLELLNVRNSLEFYTFDHNNLYPNTLSEVLTGDTTKYVYTPSIDKKSYTLCPQGSTDPADCMESLPYIDTGSSASSTEEY